MSIQVFEGKGIDSTPIWHQIVWIHHDVNPLKAWHGTYRGVKVSVVHVKSRTKWQWVYGKGYAGVFMLQGKEQDTRMGAYGGLIEHLEGLDE